MGPEKQNIYAIVEGESPVSTPPSTPLEPRETRLGKNLPNIFPRKKNLISNDSNSEEIGNYQYDKTLSSDLETNKKLGFNRVTLI